VRWFDPFTTRRNREFSMSMIHVLWHDSIMISSTDSVSHELMRIKPRFHVGSVTVDLTRTVGPERYFLPG
jgi:hypothetical protein